MWTLGKTLHRRRLIRRYLEDLEEDEREEALKAQRNRYLALALVWVLPLVALFLGLGKF